MSNVPSYARLVDVSTALSKQGVVSVLGVVVDVFLTPRQSRGTSYCTVFTIKDTNIDNGHTWDGLKVKYFRDNESQIPHVKEGDVILLRNIRVRDDSTIQSLQVHQLKRIIGQNDLPRGTGRGSSDPDNLMGTVSS